MYAGKATLILAIVLAVYVLDVSAQTHSHINIGNVTSIPQAVWNEFAARIRNLTAPLSESLQSTATNLRNLLQSNPHGEQHA